MRIRCDDLVFAYPGSDFRLAVPRWDIETGGAVALVGPSGSGKTTLLDLIAGVRLPVAGRITVGPEVISAWPDRRRRAFRLRHVGFVFQSFELFGHLTARENMLLPAAMAGLSRSDWAAAAAEADRLAAATGMADKLGRRADALSRGEQQRVALCRALVLRPAVILADEPTGNLDPGNKEAAMRLLIAAAADRGTTLIVATHDTALLPLFGRVIDLAEIGRPAPPVEGRG